MTPAQRLLDRLGRGLLRLGRRLRLLAAAGEAARAAPSEATLDARSQWLQRVAHLPPQAWQRQGAVQPEVPADASPKLSPAVPAGWPAVVANAAPRADRPAPQGAALQAPAAPPPRPAQPSLRPASPPADRLHQAWYLARQTLRRWALRWPTPHRPSEAGKPLAWAWRRVSNELAPTVRPAWPSPPTRAAAAVQAAQAAHPRPQEPRWADPVAGDRAEAAWADEDTHEPHTRLAAAMPNPVVSRQPHRPSDRSEPASGLVHAAHVAPVFHAAAEVARHKPWAGPGVAAPGALPSRPDAMPSWQRLPTAHAAPLAAEFAAEAPSPNPWPTLPAWPGLENESGALSDHRTRQRHRRLQAEQAG